MFYGRLLSGHPSHQPSQPSQCKLLCAIHVVNTVHCMSNTCMYVHVHDYRHPGVPCYMYMYIVYMCRLWLGVLIYLFIRLVCPCTCTYSMSMYMYIQYEHCNHVYQRGLVSAAHTSLVPHVYTCLHRMC